MVSLNGKDVCCPAADLLEMFVSRSSQSGQPVSSSQAMASSGRRQATPRRHSPILQHNRNFSRLISAPSRQGGLRQHTCIGCPLQVERVKILSLVQRPLSCWGLKYSMCIFTSLGDDVYLACQVKLIQQTHSFYLHFLRLEVMLAERLICDGDASQCS